MDSRGVQNQPGSRIPGVAAEGSPSTEPNFFIAGTTKGGTSTLHLWLRQHPDIFLPIRKELHFFCSCPARLKDVHTLSQYLAHFSGSTEAIVGEASPCYLYYPGVPGAIAEQFPESRILISLRDPVERFWSHYLMNSMYQRPYTPLEEVVDYWTRNVDQIAFENLVGMGMYRHQVERYLSAFNGRRVLVMFLEELEEDPAAVLGDVWRFLDLPSLDIDTSDRDKMHVVPRGRLGAWLLNDEKARAIGVRLLSPKVRRRLKYGLLGATDAKPELPPGIRKRLIGLYRPDVVGLEKLLGRRVPWGWHGDI